MSERSFDGRLDPARRWQPIAYTLAIVLPVVVLLLRGALAASFGDRPMLILFMAPISLCALLGGWGPGALSVVMVAALTDYFLIRPVHDWAIGGNNDLMQWSALIANGALVSLIGELFRRARLREAGFWQNRAAEQLESHQFTEAILDAVNANIAVIDRRGVIVAVNRRWKDFAVDNGLQLRGNLEDYGVGSNYIQLCRDCVGAWSEGAIDVAEAIEAVLTRRLASATLEYACHSPQRQRWFSLAITPFGENDFGAVVAHIDITQRKLAEQAVAASEKRFRDIVDVTADWIWEIGVDGRYTYTSNNVQALIGYAPDEVLGKTPFDFMPHDEAERVGKVFAECCARRAPFRDMDNVICDNNGGLRHVQSNGTPIYDADGQWIGYRGLDRDVTEAKLAELSLRQSEQRFRTLFDNAAVAISVHDAESGALIEANRKVLEGFGCASIDDVAGHIEDIPWSREAVRLAIRSALVAPQRCEWLCHRRDGREFWLDVLLERIVLDGVERVLAVSQDISERKAAREALRRRSEELSERNQELERFNKLMVGRELDLIDMKRKINALSLQLGLEAPYSLTFLDESAAGEGD